MSPDRQGSDNRLCRALSAQGVLSGLVLSLAFGYTVLRAIKISVFHDEAYDVLVYVPRTFFAILTQSDNKHVLNTLAQKVLLNYFPLSEICIRLPALTGHLLYLFGVFRISKLWHTRIPLAFPIMLWGLQPFILELFSAARGYGLALGFFIQGLFYFLEWVRAPFSKDRRSQAHRALFFMALAAYSNLSFLHIFLGSILLILGVEIITWKNDYLGASSARKSLCPLFRILWVPVSLTMGVALLCFFPFMQSLSQGSLYHGGTRGFWSDTVHSLIVDILYAQGYATPGLIHLIIIFTGIIIGLAMATVFETRKKDGIERELNHATSLLLGLLFICAGTIAFLWKTMGIKYVMGRHAVYFIPLFLMLVLLLLEQGLRTSRVILKGISRLGLWLLTILVVTHFFLSANMDHFYLCPYDANTKAMMAELSAQINTENLPRNAVSLGTNWIFVPSSNFYKVKNKIRWLRWTTALTLSKEFDYYYLASEASPWQNSYGLISAEKVRDSVPLRVIKEFPTTGTSLAKRDVK
jgi:hypothetical protein